MPNNCKFCGQQHDEPKRGPSPFYHLLDLQIQLNEMHTLVLEKCLPWFEQERRRALRVEFSKTKT